MSLEASIDTLAAAVTRNNELLEQILKQGGLTAPEAAAPVKAPKKEKAKAEPVEVEPEPEVEVTPEQEPAEVEVTPEPEPETPAADETAGWDRTKFILEITEKVKKIFAEAGPNLPAKQKEFAALRATFGAAKTSDVADKDLPAFYAAVALL